MIDTVDTVDTFDTVNTVDMGKGHKKTFFYFPSKKGWGQKIFIRKKSEFSPCLDQFLTNFDHFFS